MQNTLKYTNSLGQNAMTEIVFNRDFAQDAPYGPTQKAVLNDEAFDIAQATISGWPGYVPTPLHALSGLAAQAGVSGLYYKDEGGRFGLGSFKALGGAYAVLRLLMREISIRKGIEEPTIKDILDRVYDDVVSTITACCATDGNHGRSVAWGAQTFGCQCEIFIHATVSDGRKTANWCCHGRAGHFLD